MILYAVEEVVKQETPIHFDLLCKRVSILFGNQKVTSKVRNNVEDILYKKLKYNIAIKDEFGFNCTGANITQAMENACTYLLHSGKVKEVDRKIILS